MNTAFLYGTAWKEERTAELTLMALRAGFRGIDTANQRKHYFEAGVGEALRAAYAGGIVTREDVFLQTKFTYQRGQDERLPYDPAAPLARQVEQSLASSLEHLGTEYVDSFVLHGPSSGHGWTRDDADVWESMRAQQAAGRARVLGVSNVSLEHLEQMGDVPAFVQNRCYAQTGWDREIRAWCREHGSVYQGFSLLTANVPVLRHPPVVEVARELGIGVAQLIFAFARQVGMLPLTGTTDERHMREDLASLKIELPEEVVKGLERIAG